MKKRNSKILCEMFLMEKNFRKEYDISSEDITFHKTYCTDNFVIKKNFLYNTLFAHKVITPSKYSSHQTDKYDNEKLVKRFFPKLYLPFFVIFVFLFFVLISRNLSNALELSDIKYILYFLVPIYTLLFLSTFRLNIKYWKIIRQIKRQEIEIEDEMDSKFVEEMINKNLKFYRKIKLKKLNKV